MSQSIVIQLAATAAALAGLLGVAFWAKTAKPLSPLSDERARDLLQSAFPSRSLEQIWVAVDGRGALAKSGAAALVICEAGDGYVARHIPWAQAVASSFKDGVVRLDLSDVSAPEARLALQGWPPEPEPDQRAA